MRRVSNTTTLITKMLEAATRFNEYGSKRQDAPSFLTRLLFLLNSLGLYNILAI